MVRWRTCLQWCVSGGTAKRNVFSARWINSPASTSAAFCLRKRSPLYSPAPRLLRTWWWALVESLSEIKCLSGLLHCKGMFFPPQVKARSVTREVIATYSVDDIFIELVIQLPQNYPLGSILVESGRRVGVAVQQWRNWMLQLSTYLTHQVQEVEMFSV